MTWYGPLCPYRICKRFSLSELHMFKMYPSTPAGVCVCVHRCQLPCLAPPLPVPPLLSPSLAAASPVCVSLLHVQIAAVSLATHCVSYYFYSRTVPHCRLGIISVGFSCYLSSLVQQGEMAEWRKWQECSEIKSHS